jgi:NAD(P)H-hydrate epimerase
VIPILTPAEMGAVDAAAADPVEVLIERAGAAVAREALALLGGAYGRHVVVLAGKGNNGADGRAAAQRLRRRGARVTIVEAATAPDVLPGADLVIDAAYGTGFRGDHVAPHTTAPVLAVDIPSGIDGLTGAEPGRALDAVCTVTFAALKPGLLLEPGASRAGDIVVADIGLDVDLPLRPARCSLVEAVDAAAALPSRPADAHKWRSAVLVVAGSPGMGGAAHLAAAAAQRTGSGMVRLASPGVDDPDRPLEAVAVSLPDRDWVEAAVEASERCHAAVIGPGLGRGCAAEVRDLLGRLDLPAVVDGDGLAAFAGDAAGLRSRSAATVLTPHDGEHELLTGKRPAADRIATARQLAATTGAVVLLKGPTTVVVDPDGEARVVVTGDARLATAGTGDVLSGIVGSLLAQGLPALDAAATGAWLHGRAASLGPSIGLVAGDIVDLLPAVLDVLKDDDDLEDDE